MQIKLRNIKSLSEKSSLSDGGTLPQVSYLYVTLLLPGFYLCVLSGRTSIQEHQQNQTEARFLLLRPHLWIQTTAVAWNVCQEATELG